MKKKFYLPLIAFWAVFSLHATYVIWKNIELANKWSNTVETNWFLQYFIKQDFLLGISYALAVAFTVYALVRFFENRKTGIKGTLGGLTLMGIIYFGGCFLIGCCGSPMLIVYLNLFGASFLGFTKIIIFALTTISIIISYFWLNKKSKNNTCNCGDNSVCNTSTNSKSIIDIEKELQNGMKLAKCKKCDCMKDFLETANQYFSTHQTNQSTNFLAKIRNWQTQIQPTEYSCLGCKYCFPAVASNIFYQNFADTEVKQNACNENSCNCNETKQELWPPMTGEYFALCNGRDCPVAVSTLASVELAEKLANLKPEPLCIVGKTETENIGIDKIIKNTISNKTIKHLILSGIEPEGHKTSETILSLIKNGVDENNRIIGSTGKRPILQNVTKNEIQSFREQINVIDLIGCTDENIIINKINEISQTKKVCTCKDCNENEPSKQITTPETVTAQEPTKIEMDKNGYFVVYPQKNGQIIVEHYSNANKLLRTINGQNTREIYWTIIGNGWISQLSHAAYLGKELTKAELSQKYNFKYIQDGA